MSSLHNNRTVGGQVGGNVQRAQWDTWSGCHCSAKLGLISLQAKLVFIASLGVRELWVRVVNQEGGMYVICQQTASTDASHVP